MSVQENQDGDTPWRNETHGLAFTGLVAKSDDDTHQEDSGPGVGMELLHSEAGVPWGYARPRTPALMEVSERPRQAAPRSKEDARKDARAAPRKRSGSPLSELHTRTKCKRGADGRKTLEIDEPVQPDRSARLLPAVADVNSADAIQAQSIVDDVRSHIRIDYSSVGVPTGDPPVKLVLSAPICDRANLPLSRTRTCALLSMR
ncbi:hypothetical protein BV20DRAFT_616651 [Pilatotrama ljubarskyi]|nr:hypothetical protein BV20DRAFT_616651 [Pilatotrama ljubarskyi]